MSEEIKTVSYTHLDVYKRQVLAIDLGASSGRAIIGQYRDGQLGLGEVHRFPNDPVAVGGELYWDFLRLFHEIKQGLRHACLLYPSRCV